MKSKCAYCYYSWKANVYDGGALWACDYIGVENRRRPCPPGQKCTVFKPKTRRKHSIGWFQVGRWDDD